MRVIRFAHARFGYSTHHQLTFVILRPISIGVDAHVMLGFFKPLSVLKDEVDKICGIISINLDAGDISIARV
jgi:hypothetical protein